MSGKAIVVVLAAVLVIAGSAAFAATEQDVTLTVTIRSLGVSVSPATYNFGIMDAGEDKLGDTSLVVTNEGNDTEDLGVRIKDEDDWDEWTAVTPAGPNQYILGCRLTPTGQPMGTTLTTTVQWCDGTNFSGGGNDMAADATENMWFWFRAPTSVSGAHATDQHTITVEVSCRLAE